MDTAQLLKLLNENRVKFLIIGATAFPVHGYTRATVDIDFFIEPTEENARRTLKTLEQFGYDIKDLSVQELLDQKILLRGYVVESDFHPFVAGVPDFTSVWEKRVEGNIEGVPVSFVDLDSLIQMKEAAGRPKDLEDLKYLKPLRK